MKPKVIVGFPPNYTEIVRALGRPPDSAIFAWGDRIFRSQPGPPLDRPLLAHEETHLRQQEKIGGPEAWWARYLVDRTFRLEQEIAAYRAQYRLAIELSGERWARRILLPKIAADLASPMYGNMIRPERAFKAIAA